ncbi:putative porin [Erwinia persicina]|jgi:predicted porin|uniref:Uncharacterized protein n=2 Tax=Erwinia TaxID=551 RepID=A0ABV4E788_9GAMM|nr:MULTISPECIES: hypothetical protein [Erwinia]MCP1438050.1 putative porin [Erwinia persicina]MDN4626634.1 hypothetical protein [Erwinia sp. PsM31]MDN8543021.1 hypothetical protein [Erwinia sp. BC051422]
MKAVYMALGLMMAGQAAAASITGSIGVRLTIYSQCHIDGQSTITARTPAVDCGQQRAAQPKVTQTAISSNRETRQTSKLVTVEW